MEQLKKFAPPGIDLAHELGVYAFGLFISFMISLAYFVRLFDVRSDYIIYSTTEGRMVNPDFAMPYFAHLIRGVFIGEVVERLRMQPILYVDKS